MAGCRVNDHAPFFVDNNQVAVLIYDIEGNVLSNKLCTFRLRQLNLKNITATAFIILFYPLSAKTYLAFIQQFLCCIAAHALNKTRKESVDTLAALLCTYCYDFFIHFT